MFGQYILTFYPGSSSDSSPPP